MTENFRGLAVFVAVVEAGSFSGAGRRLKLSTSVVSHHVSKLEADIGAPLFFRSTRSLSLTSEGTAILDAARRMVAAGREAFDALAQQSEQPVGALRLTVPAFGGNSPVHQAVLGFARAHPMVAVTMHSTDKPVDLVREGYDLAIRLGKLADSALKSRRIGAFHRKLVAAPAYLADIAPVHTLEDLARCDFVSVSVLADTVSLTRGGEDIVVPMENTRVEVDSITAAKTAVAAGLGVMSLPVSEISDDLEAGRLVEILPEWQLPVLGVFALWPGSGSQKSLTRRLIDFLVEHGGETA